MIFSVVFGGPRVAVVCHGPSFGFFSSYFYFRYSGRFSFLFHFILSCAACVFFVYFSFCFLRSSHLLCMRFGRFAGSQTTDEGGARVEQNSPRLRGQCHFVCHHWMCVCVCTKPIYCSMKMNHVQKFMWNNYVENEMVKSFSAYFLICCEWRVSCFVISVYFSLRFFFFFHFIVVGKVWAPRCWHCSPAIF